MVLTFPSSGIYDTKFTIFIYFFQTLLYLQFLTLKKKSKLLFKSQFECGQF